MEKLAENVEKPTEAVTNDQIVSDSLLESIIDKKLDSMLSKVFDRKTASGLSSWADSKKPAQSYGYTSYRKFDDGYLQSSHSTQEERYPKIFDAAVGLKPNAKRVLSFGCSKGDEIFALARRFPNAEQLVGVDIDHYSIKEARDRNKQANVYFHDTLGGLGQFDVVTALNVFFCLEKPIPKEQWTKWLTDLTAYIAPSGLLMIFKSDHDPMDVLGDGFKAENTWSHTHNRNNKDYFCGYYRKKSKRWWNK